MDAIKRLSRQKTIARLIDFFESSFFPVALGGVAFLLYAFNLPVATVALFALCGTFIALFCKDTRSGLSLVLFFVITLHYKDSKPTYATPFAFVVYALVGAPFIASLVYRLVKYPVAWKSKSGLIGMALLCVALLLGGVFTKYYSLDNFGYALAISATLFCSYAFFAFTMQKRSDNLLYLARVCAVAVCMIAMQVLLLYLRKYEWGTPLDAVWKKKLILGWSIGNMAAELVAVLLPAVFYLIYKEKYGYYYWAVVIIGIVGVYFTLGRNALLWSAIVSVLGLLANCVVGEHKKINRGMAAIVLVLAVILLLILYVRGNLGELMAFFLETGLQDRGRFRIWREHWNYFLTSPLHGIGFESYMQLSGTMVSKAHNNIVQMLAGGGVIGLTLYVVHRVQTVKLLLKKPTVERLFMGSCIVVGLMISMLSSLFFHFYFAVYYSLILLTIEKSVSEE